MNQLIDFLVSEILRGSLMSPEEVAEGFMVTVDLLSIRGIDTASKAADIQCCNNIHECIKVLNSWKNETKGIAVFEKVSREIFEKSAEGLGYTDNYDKVKVPVRATSGSAGYDIVTPYDVKLKPGETVLIPSGIRCKMNKDYVLVVAPKSGLGFKYRTQLDNTIGIIDSDYYNSDNEGHIMIKLTNDSRDGKTLKVEAGKAVCQGIFLKYGITVDDAATGVRNGGFGSTNS